MDNVREKIKEQNKIKQRKLVLGIVVVAILILAVIFIERAIRMNITEIVINKGDISEEKAVFIPVKPLDTNIIAVKLTDGNYRLAFDDCTACYVQEGKHSKFSNNHDSTGLICENCNAEILYEEMGFLPEEAMPYPIDMIEIINTDESFILPVEYLENTKLVLKEMRSGKIKNNYSENPES